MSEKACRGPECDRPVKLKGLCASHGQQLWRHGGNEAALIPIGTYVKPDQGCSVEECERKHFARGQCQLHYQREWLKARKEQE